MRKRQGILIISDGLGERPIKALGGLTPLEYANTPNLDRLARDIFTMQMDLMGITKKEEPDPEK